MTASAIASRCSPRKPLARDRIRRGFLVWLGLAACGVACAAHQGPLDPAFGDGGMRNYGFQSYNGSGLRDRGLLACPTPDGRLTVIGTASDERRIVTLRLLPNGDYDTSFSGDGKESFDFVTPFAVKTYGACQPNGDLVLALRRYDTLRRDYAQVIRVSAATGLLDPGFGQNGSIEIDVTALHGLNGPGEALLGVNVLANGDIAVGGQVQLNPTAWRGYVVLLSSAGAIKTSSVILNGRSRAVTMATDSPDGKLWVFGDNGRVPGAYRATLDRNTLEWQAVLELEWPTPSRYIALSEGGKLPNGDVALAAVEYGSASTAPKKPYLVVFRAQTVTALALPNIQFGASAGSIVGFVEPRLMATPDRRVVYGIDVQSTADARQKGIYLAMAVLGSSAGADRLDTRFAQQGAGIALFRPDHASCVSNPPEMNLSSVTSWQGRPTFTGKADVGCINAGSNDYVVGRLHTDTIFASGFE